ncbi:MAG: hypothetical protein CMP47_09150 [Rickettsiales bacterium]|nr:hypothetical protein [Rickettsiales bacterium]
MLWLLIALALFVVTRVSPSRNGPVAARLYDWGLFGLFPRQSYKSSDLRPPLLNYARRDRRCDSGFSVIGPRGTMVSTPGPVILDWQGELIWMEDQYGQAMDVKVQHTEVETI